MEKFSLMQAACAIRHCIEFFRSNSGQGDNDTIILAAEYGHYVLEYTSQYESMIKAAIKLQKRDPNLAQLFRELPGLEIVDIREPTLLTKGDGNGH